MRDNDFDARRGSARARGYTAQWDRASLDFRRQHPLCLGCEARGRIAVAAVTDHVVPHRGDMALFWDRSRWQPACHWCHSVVKQILETLFEHGSIVEADLWLNSPRAIAIARRESILTGADGWPVER